MQDSKNKGMPINKKWISDGYDRLADNWGEGLDDEFYRRVLSIHNVHTGEGKILDIGCGRGSLLQRLSHITPNAMLHWIDISPKLCDISRKNNPLAEIILGDAESLPYDDDTFDVVFMTEVLEHMLDYGRALSEVSRVLKSGGTFVVTVPNRDWFRYDFYDKLRNKNMQPVDDYYFRFKEIKTLLEEKGFRILKHRGSDNLFYYAPYHKYEQILVFFLPFLHKKMKRIIFKCVNDKCNSRR